MQTNLPSLDPRPATRSRIHQGAQSLGVALDELALDRLAVYADELVRWNSRIRLVGPADIETIVDDHVLDGLAVARLIPEDAPTSWVDIGSGAGLPGLILATVFPARHFDLVEPIHKKHAFMSHAIGLLQLANARSHNGRDESIDFDTAGFGAVSRATFAPDVWARRARDLVGPTGAVVVCLGAAAFADLQASASRVDPVQLPRGAPRTNLYFAAQAT